MISIVDMSTFQYRGAERSNYIVKKEQLYKCTQANIGQTMQNDDTSRTVI